MMYVDYRLFIFCIEDVSNFRPKLNIIYLSQSIDGETLKRHVYSPSSIVTRLKVSVWRPVNDMDSTGAAATLDAGAAVAAIASAQSDVPKSNDVVRVEEIAARVEEKEIHSEIADDTTAEAAPVVELKAKATTAEPEKLRLNALSRKSSRAGDGVGAGAGEFGCF